MSVLQVDMSSSGFISNDPRTIFLENFLKNRFSKKDCISLDIHLKEAKDVLAYLKAEKLKGYKMLFDSQPDLVKESLSDFTNYINNKATSYWKDRTTNRKSFYGGEMGGRILPYYILKLENEITNSNCRAEIEKKRLEESAEILTKQSAVSEKNVLKPNYKEQYIYIGLGVVVLFTGLYIIGKK